MKLYSVWKEFILHLILLLKYKEQCSSVHLAHFTLKVSMKLHSWPWKYKIILTQDPQRGFFFCRSQQHITIFITSRLTLVVKKLTYHNKALVWSFGQVIRNGCIQYGNMQQLWATLHWCKSKNSGQETEKAPEKTVTASTVKWSKSLTKCKRTVREYEEGLPRLTPSLNPSRWQVRTWLISVLDQTVKRN